MQPIQHVLAKSELLALVISFLPLSSVSLGPNADSDLVPGPLFRAVASSRRLYLDPQSSYLWKRVLEELGVPISRFAEASPRTHFELLGVWNWKVLPYFASCLELSRAESSPNRGSRMCYRFIRNQRLYWGFTATDLPCSSGFAFTVTGQLTQTYVNIGLSPKIYLGAAETGAGYAPFEELLRTAVLYEPRDGLVTGPDQTRCKHKALEIKPADETRVVSVTIEYDPINGRMLIAADGAGLGSAQLPVKFDRKLHGIIALGSETQLEIRSCTAGLIPDPGVIFDLA